MQSVSPQRRKWELLITLDLKNSLISKVFYANKSNKEQENKGNNRRKIKEESDVLA